MQRSGKRGHHLPGRLCEQRAQLLQVTTRGCRLCARTCLQPAAGPWGAALWILQTWEGQRKPENEDALGTGVQSLSICYSSFFLRYLCK